MVKFIRNLILYWQFKRTLKRCDKLNAKSAINEKHIVANICGHPHILTRKSFRKMRQKGIFKHSLTWTQVCGKQVTHKSLKEWTS